MIVTLPGVFLSVAYGKMLKKLQFMPKIFCYYGKKGNFANKKYKYLLFIVVHWHINLKTN